jgi:CubicO group peptidase (beta-lactamase class C family)
LIRRTGVHGQHRPRRTSALPTVCALVPAAGSAVAAPPAVMPDTAALQAALGRVAAIGVVTEVRPGDAVWRGSSGRTRLIGRQPAPVEGRFRAGRSITKTFTATVILRDDLVRHEQASSVRRSCIRGSWRM